MVDAWLILVSRLAALGRCDTKIPRLPKVPYRVSQALCVSYHLGRSTSPDCTSWLYQFRTLLSKDTRPEVGCSLSGECPDCVADDCLLVGHLSHDWNAACSSNSWRLRSGSTARKLHARADFMSPDLIVSGLEATLCSDTIVWIRGVDSRLTVSEGRESWGGFWHALPQWRDRFQRRNRQFGKLRLGTVGTSRQPRGITSA